MTLKGWLNRCVDGAHSCFCEAGGEGRGAVYLTYMHMGRSDGSAASFYQPRCPARGEISMAPSSCPCHGRSHSLVAGCASCHYGISEHVSGCSRESTFRCGNLDNFFQPCVRQVVSFLRTATISDNSELTPV